MTNINNFCVKCIFLQLAGVTYTSAQDYENTQHLILSNLFVACIFDTIMGTV